MEASRPPGIFAIPAIGKPCARSIREVQRQRRLSSWRVMKAMSWNPLTLHRRRPHVWSAPQCEKAQEQPGSLAS